MRTRVRRRLLGVGAALFGVEIVLVGCPLYALLELSEEGRKFALFPILAALLLGGAAWIACMLVCRAPIDILWHKKSLGQSLVSADAEHALVALVALPRRALACRFLILSIGVGVVAFSLEARSGFARGDALSATISASISAYVAGWARALCYRRVFESVRSDLLPNVDAMRFFGNSYRDELVGAAILTGAVGAVLSALFVYGYTGVTFREAVAIQTQFPPIIAAFTLLWYLAVRRLPRAIDAYLEARTDERAAKAHQVAQALPYWLAGSKVIAWSLASVALGITARRIGLSPGRSLVLTATGAIMTLGVAQIEAIWHRSTLRPLLSHLAGRHRLRIDVVRTPFSLRTKLLGSFGGLVVFACALSLLFAFLDVRGLGAAALFALGVLGISVAIIVVTVRDLTDPLRGLEERAFEMARGELARPVVLPGEADEIGRLAFAFEEMRRALREKLRSTESVSVALEREVLRRTEDLERTNRELRETLSTLRRAQDELVRSEKMASMGRLVAGIAHEINNPVNAVVNSLSPLRSELTERIGPKLPEDIDDMLRVIQRGAERTKAIVQALHHYSRGDVDRISEVDLHRGIDETLELLKYPLRDHVTVEKHYGTVGRVRGHAGQLQQVFVNLLVNAAQALAAHRSAENPGKIRIATETSMGEVIIRIGDNGPGIPTEVLPRIFDPFFTTKEVGEGSGLGLSIAHGIVERHGGRITVSSQIGKGTEFCVYLPA